MNKTILLVSLVVLSMAHADENADKLLLGNFYSEKYYEGEDYKISDIWKGVGTHSIEGGLYRTHETDNRTHETDMSISSHKFTSQQIENGEYLVTIDSVELFSSDCSSDEICLTGKYKRIGKRIRDYTHVYWENEMEQESIDDRVQSWRIHYTIWPQKITPKYAGQLELEGYFNSDTTNNPDPIMADVNGDGRDDVVEFVDDGVRVSLSTGTEFKPHQLWIAEFGENNNTINKKTEGDGNEDDEGGWHVSKHLRMMADVDGDGKADVVGFGNDGIYVSLSTGMGFAQPEHWIEEFGYNNKELVDYYDGWRRWHTRVLADVNGDNRADVIGFQYGIMHVSLSTGTEFSSSQQYEVKGYYNRIADVNGDGTVDVVGFRGSNVYVSLSTNGGDELFGDSKRWANYSNNEENENENEDDKYHWNSRSVNSLADVNGDGKDDIIDFYDKGILVSLAGGGGFGSLTQWSKEFGSDEETGNWNDKHPRKVVDINHDGMADVIGFYNDGVWVALSTGKEFAPSQRWFDEFGYHQHWRTHLHPRILADVNNDKQPDIVGFGADDILVALATGTGFTAPEHWANYSDGIGWHSDKHLRMLADVNGDNKNDIVVFGDKEVEVALATETAFSSPQTWIDAFGYLQNWRVDSHPRQLTDINGDVQADIVGIHDEGVWVALSTGTEFTQPQVWSSDYSLKAGWEFDKHSRKLADVNGDGRLDVVGFRDKEVWVALSTSSAFTQAKLWLNYNDNQNLQVENPYLADVNGDGRADIVQEKEEAILVFLSTSDGFDTPIVWTQKNFFNYYMRENMMADVNGDGMADVVRLFVAYETFSWEGAFVLLSTGTEFSPPQIWTRSVMRNVKMVDVNNDDKVDIVEFHDDGILVHLSNGVLFTTPQLLANYGDSFKEPHYFLWGDVNSDSLVDVVEFGETGIFVSRSHGLF